MPIELYKKSMFLLLVLAAVKKAHQRAASQNKVQSLPIRIFNWFSFAVAWLPFVVVIVSIIVVFLAAAGTAVPTTPRTIAVLYRPPNQRVPQDTNCQQWVLATVWSPRINWQLYCYYFTAVSITSSHTNSTVIGKSRLPWINANEAPSVECLA